MMKTKNRALNFFGKMIISKMFILGLAACATSQVYQNNYQVREGDFSQSIHVSRDDKAYKRHQKEIVSNCPTKLYINTQEAGRYLVGEHSSYDLVPGNYTFQVENCQGRCSTYDVDFVVDSEVPAPSFVLSVDLSGKPFIIRK